MRQSVKKPSISLKDSGRIRLFGVSTLVLVALSGCSGSSGVMDFLFSEKPKQMIPQNRRVPVMNPGGYYGPPANYVPGTLPAAPPPANIAPPPPPPPSAPKAPPAEKKESWFEFKSPFDQEPEKQVEPYDQYPNPPAPAPAAPPRDQQSSVIRKPIEGNANAEQMFASAQDKKPEAVEVASVEKKESFDLLASFRQWMTHETPAKAEPEAQIAAADLPALAPAAGEVVVAETPAPAAEEIKPLLMAAADSYPSLNTVPQTPPELKRALAAHPAQKKELEATAKVQAERKQALDSDPEPGSMLREYKDGIPAPEQIPDIDRPIAEPLTPVEPGAEPALEPAKPASSAAEALPSVAALHEGRQWTNSLELASAHLTAYTLPEKRFLPESRYAQRRNAAATSHE